MKRQYESAWLIGVLIQIDTYGNYGAWFDAERVDSN